CHNRAHLGQTLGGIGVALRPAAMIRDSVCLPSASTGQLLGELASQKRLPPAVELAAARPAAERLERREFARRARVRGHGSDDRGVWNESARRDVAGPGERVTCKPQLPYHGELPRRPNLLPARDLSPRLRRLRLRRAQPHRLELLLGEPELPFLV